MVPYPLNIEEVSAGLAPLKITLPIINIGLRASLM